MKLKKKLFNKNLLSSNDLINICLQCFGFFDQSIPDLIPKSIWNFSTKYEGKCNFFLKYFSIVPPPLKKVILNCPLICGTHFKPY